MDKSGVFFESWPNVYEGCGIGISNTPEKCAQEFNEWYEKEDVDVLISCGGGELMCEILPYVDFEKIRQEEPKWFMGYSDNTNLLFYWQLFVIPQAFMARVQQLLAWNRGMNR